MSIIIKLDEKRGVELEREEFILLAYCKERRKCIGDTRVTRIKKLREGLQIPEETTTPEEIHICYDGECDVVCPKEGETLSDFLKSVYSTTQEAIEYLEECEIYHTYFPLYETEKEVVWLGARYRAKEVRFRTVKKVSDRNL